MRIPNKERVVRLENDKAKLRSALMQCVGVLAGETLSKSALIDALEQARLALEQTK